MPPLLLDDDEAIAIAVGLRHRRPRLGDRDRGDRGARAGQARAGAARPPAPPRRGARARRRSRRRSAGPTVDPQHLTVIAAACRDTECLRFAYRSRDGTDSRREVEPHALVNLGRRWYLVAWDRRREDWRTFRVDRLARPGLDRRALHAAHAARHGCGRVRRAEHHRRAEPLRGTRHAARRRRRDRRPRPRALGDDRADRRRSTLRATAPATTTSAGSRCGSRCSASTSRCTSRPSWSSTCGRSPGVCSGPPSPSG